MILLVGPSASGKTEVAKLLKKSHGIRKVVTHTTRPPRIGEVDGVDYHFVSEERFLEMERNGEFVETTVFSGKHYGSSIAEVADDKALIVDPIGLDAYLALHNPHIVSFYLDTSDELRERRMKERGDSSEDIARRLKNDETAFLRVSPTTYVLKNETGPLEELAEKVYRLYQEELARLS